MPKRGRIAGRESGAAMVEFALLLPVMLLIIGGIVDFGRFFYVQVTLANAAREGVRAAAISTASAGAVQTRAQAAATFSISTSTPPPVLCTAGSTGNAQVSVSTTFNWNMLGPALSIFAASDTLPTSLSYEGVMRCGG